MPLSPRANLNDLLSDAGFRLWVKTGDFKKTDNEWSRWRRVHPEKEETIRQAVHILLSSHVDESISETEVDEIVSGTWQKIHQKQKKNIFQLQWWWAAACITLLLAGIWTVRIFRNSPVDSAEPVIAGSGESGQWNQRMNTEKKPMLIILPDSSSVVLLSGSVLEYPAQFSAAIREVTLTGEAFFEVSKNADKPFLVHTPTITARVIGTSFTVRAYDKESQVKVAVKTGKVSVYANTENKQKVPVNAVLVLPDQHITYDKTDRKMQVPESGSEKTELAIRNAAFDFTDAPVTEILDSIASVYGVEINYEAADLKKCILTTSLTDVPLHGKLKIICNALGSSVNYEMSGKNIVVKGRGCAL